MLGCDYFSAYRKYMRECGVLVQFCMAHLIGDVKFLLTLPGREDQAYGQRVRDALRDLFAVIHRREKMTATAFQKVFEAAREQVMKTATARVPDTKHARNLAKRFRENGEAYFRFITTPGIESDEQPGRTGDPLRGDRPPDYPGNAERKRPSLVRADLDGDCHLRLSRVERSFRSCWIRCKPICAVLPRPHCCRQAPDGVLTAPISP